MKRTILCGYALLISTALCAEQEMSVADMQKKADTIEYSMIIMRDETYDDATWNRMVDIAAHVTQKRDTNDNEMFDAAIAAMKESFALAGAPGIHGIFHIEIGNDEALLKGCDGVCGGDDHKER